MINSEKYRRVETALGKFFTKVNYCKKRCRIYSDGILLGCCLPHLSGHGTKEEIAHREKLFGKRSNNPGRCGFHSEKGCKLKTNKPPICVSYICNDYKKFLKDNYGVHFDEELVHKMLVDAKYNWITEEKIGEFERIVDGWIKKVKAKK